MKIYSQNVIFIWFLKFHHPCRHYSRILLSKGKYSHSKFKKTLNYYLKFFKKLTFLKVTTYITPSDSGSKALSKSTRLKNNCLQLFFYISFDKKRNPRAFEKWLRRDREMLAQNPAGNMKEALLAYCIINCKTSIK